MKTQNYFLLLLSFAAVLILNMSAIGCGDSTNSDNGDDNPPASMVGTWVFTHVTLDGVEQDLGEFFEWNTNTVSSTLEVFADGTGLSREWDQQGNNIYYTGEQFEITGDNIVVTRVSENGTPLQNTEESFNGTWAPDGDNIVLTQTQDDNTIVITLAPADPPSIPAGAQGTWTATSVTVDGESQDLATFFEWDDAATRATYLVDAHGFGLYEELSEDNAVVFYDNETLNFDGDDLTIIMVSMNGETITPEVTFTGTWNLTGDQMVLTATEDGSTIVLTWNK